MELPVNYLHLNQQDRIIVRTQYIDEQNGKCFFCKKSLSKTAPKKITTKQIDWKLFPKNFMNYPVHLQHNHNSGMTEGAVHNYCNAVLWQYYGK